MLRAEANRLRNAVRVAPSLDTRVSPDSVVSHQKFTGKHGLTFPLLSDPDQTVAKAYGVWVQKSLDGRTYMGSERTTFIIDERGKIARIFPKVKVAGHVEEVLAAL
mgnify:CR=1 FL=1